MGQDNSLSLPGLYLAEVLKIHIRLLICKSCTTCGRVKAPQHKPYGMLKQLPIPEKLWNSISMDFIEQLPESSSFTIILIVVVRLQSKGFSSQWPMKWTPWSWPVSSYSMSSQNMEFHHMSPLTMAPSLSPTFSAHWAKSLIWLCILPLDIIWRVMDKQNGLIRGWSNSPIVTATTNRTTGLNSCPWWSLPTTMLWAWPQEFLPSLQTRAICQVILPWDNSRVLELDFKCKELE